MMAERSWLRATVHERRLANGLTVLVAEDRRAPVVAVITHVNAGYFDESDDEVGIAHVLEHMFFKGTERRGPGDMGRETKALGGYLNAGTIYDRTSYYTVLPSAAWAQALDIQADALQNSRIDADELAKELRVIIEEARRKLDSPGAVARESLYATMFDRHRMRRWRIGTEDVLSRFTRDDVVRFYRRMYRAPNVILSIVGDIDADAVFERVEALYGGMPAEPPVRDRGPAEPDRREFRFRDLEGDLRQTHMEWGWPTVGPLHEDAPALDLFGVVLGQGRASRLYRGVRETGLVTTIGSYHYTISDIGLFGISAVGAPADARAALEATAAEVRAALRDGFSVAELERARNMIEARLIRRFETVDGQATLLAEWQALGDWRLFERYVDRLLTLEPADLVRAAEKYLQDDRAAVLVYRPPVAGLFVFLFVESPAAAGTTAVETTAARPAPARSSVPAGRVEDGVHLYETDGCRIVVQPRREVPLVTIALAWTGGTVEETAEEAGLTALMSRTALKGTLTRSAAQIATQAESLGGVLAPGTGSDLFEWYLSLPSRHLEAGLELLADVAYKPSFPDDEVARECKAAANEIQMLREDMHEYPVRLFFETAFAGDPYGHTLESLEALLARADRAALETWHARVALGRAPTLFLVGDVDPDHAASLSAAFLPAAPAQASAPRMGPPQWAAGQQRVVERETAQTALVLGFPGPTRNEPDTDALRVMAAAIGGLGGRLFEELRSRRSLAYTVSASLAARVRAGAFVAYIGTSPRREDEARAGLLEQLGRLTREPLPNDDIERAKRYLIGSRQIRLQTNGARLAELTSAVLLGRGLAELRDYEQRIRDVTPERILEVAARWLDPDRVVEATVRGIGARAAASAAAPV